MVKLLEARKVGVPELGIKLVVYAWGIQTGPGLIEVVADKVEIGHNDGVSKRPHMLYEDAQDPPPFERGVGVEVRNKYVERTKGGVRPEK